MKKSLAVVGVLVAASAAHANNAPDIIATHTGISPGYQCLFSVAGPSFMNPGEAGCFNWTRDGGSYTGVGSTFSTFCLELSELVAVNTQYTYKVVDPATAPDGGPPGDPNNLFTFPLGPAGADLMSELFGRFYPTLNLSSNDECAAFQAAVWEIVYDPNLVINNPGDSYLIDFTPAGAGVNAVVLPLAQSYLNALDGTGPRATLDAFTHPTAQDQIVPAPTGLALLGLGGLAAARRRRR